MSRPVAPITNTARRARPAAWSLRTRPAELAALVAVVALVVAAVLAVVSGSSGDATTEGGVQSTTTMIAGVDGVDGIDGAVELGLTPEQVAERERPVIAEGASGVADGLAPVEALPAVELDAVAPPAPPALPDEVDVLGGTQFAGAAPGSLVGNVHGCGARCITRATLQLSGDTTDVRVEVATDVRARTMVAFSTAAPVVDAGVPSLPGATVVQAHLPRTSFTRTVTGLQPGTTYHVLVRATDRDGGSQYATTTFETASPAVAGPGSPASCEPSCWAAARIHEVDHDSARFHLATSVAARLDVAVSPQEPGTIGGLPFLPQDVPVVVPTELRTSWDLAVDGLQPETTYHVVVRATDAAGGHTLRRGRFTTGPERVTFEATFRSATIVHDGDPGRLGSGEISLAWGLPDGGVGGRNQGDHADGSTIPLDAPNTARFTVVGDGLAPTLYVSATEFDKPQNVCTSDAIWLPLHFEPQYDETCRWRTNVASSGLVSADRLRSLPSCATYGVIGEGEDDRCLLIESERMNDDYVHFWALVSIREV